MQTFDPRTISTPVYEALSELRSHYDDGKGKRDDKRLKEQKNQAVEIYTYLSTWGLMRLKAEEAAISKDKPGKKQVVESYFKCLKKLSGVDDLDSSGERLAEGLKKLKSLRPDEYLGLTGLGLTLAQEFSFWANAIYHDITGDD